MNKIKNIKTIYLGEHNPLHHRMEQRAGDLHIWEKALRRQVGFVFFYILLFVFVFVPLGESIVTAGWILNLYIIYFFFIFFRICIYICICISGRKRCDGRLYLYCFSFVAFPLYLYLYLYLSYLYLHIWKKAL